MADWSRPSGRRILTTRRPRRTRSPLSFTSVTWSSSSTTAFTSSAQGLAGCLARLRSHSGVSACAAPQNAVIAVTRKRALIAFLSTGAASCMQYGLLFITGLDLSKKRFQFRVFFHGNKNRVKSELPLCDQLEPVKFTGVLVARVAQLGVLRLGNILQRKAGGDLHDDNVIVSEWIGEVHRILAL